MFSYLGFVKKPPAVPDEEPSDDEDSEDTEDTEDKPLDIFSSPVSYQQWGENIVVSYHFMSARDIAPHLSSWCFNRNLDHEHKDSIKKALLANNPHLMGTIQLVRDKKMNCRILNGQHRIHALKEVIAEDIDMKFDTKLMFELYDIEDIEDIENIDSSHNIVERIFKIANNSLNMKPEHDHEILCKQIVIAMMKDETLKNGIVDKTTGRVNKPRISSKELFEELKDNLESEKIKLSVNEILTKIKKINVIISSTPFIKLFGRNTPSEAKLRQFERARDLKFFLNMNCKIPPKSWIKILTRE